MISSHAAVDESINAWTRSPAKLNLFLELLGRRDDGFHEIDTIMVPIDLYDEIAIRRTIDEGVTLSVDWLPSKKIVAQRLGIDVGSDKATQLLQIPENETNLVHQALTRLRDHFDIPGGFHCELRKRIPAGAGMGGASSNAASALLCGAELCGFVNRIDELFELAASIGSDVPFFLGSNEDRSPCFAARAQGRGELLSPVSVNTALHFVFVFPGESLSTAQVYACSQIPAESQSPEAMLNALKTGSSGEIGRQLFNRLGSPAQEILPRIAEILNSMWRCGLQACQLTGSGSACFAVQSTVAQAQRAAARLKAMLEPGVFISVARSVSVPARVVIQHR